MKMREFRENDWDGLAGAEKFPDGSNPLLGEGEFTNGEKYLLVVDANGVTFFMEVENDEGEIYDTELTKAVDFPSPREARAWLGCLNLDKLNPEFIETLCGA